MDGNDYKEYYQLLIDKYLNARRMCYQCFINDKKLWGDILHIVNNKDYSEWSKTLYLSYSKYIQSYYYLLQVFGVQNFQEEQQYDIEQRDVLYFAIQQHLLGFFKQKEELFNQIREYCQDKEYSEQFFSEFYSKFLLQISEDYKVLGLNSFLDSIKEKRSILDEVYFLSRYKNIIK